MTLLEVRAVLKRIAPNAWVVARHRAWHHTFILTRIDSVELIAISELATLARHFPHYDALVSIEPRSNFPDDGVDQGVWLVPKTK